MTTQKNISFKERTKNFWETFNKEEAQLRLLVDKKEEADIIVEKLGNIVKTAFNDVAFEIGYNGDKYELIFSPNGNRTVLKQIQYLLRYAPETFDNTWNFYEAKPAQGTENMGLSIYNKKITASDFIIYPTLNKEKKIINIEVYIPLLDDLDEDTKYNVLFIMLDLFIGELYTMEYIGTIDFIEVQKSKNTESVPLSKFHAYINYLIEEYDWDKKEDLTAQYTGYSFEPIEDSNKLRDDVFIGYSASFDIINQLGNESYIYPLDLLEQDGVYMGYIYYNNEDIPQEGLVNQRADIEDKIQDIVGPNGIADSTGGATGSNNSYIDFIIYDLDAFLDLAKDVMEQYDFAPKGFVLFNKPSSIIVF